MKTLFALWIEVAAFCVLFQAYDVNCTLDRGGEPDDGETVANNIFNFAFTGISGEVTLLF